ncbi:unnamed protein product [Bemisia tabaci]|uniref:Uncharacterized protein n=1 Tax=Bemisia tabaci TaxID=7038 RepID=A0A9N9ZX04_BEMTA|nr:unnamed protein product [Bemisia tabaci]
MSSNSKSYQNQNPRKRGALAVQLKFPEFRRKLEENPTLELAKQFLEVALALCNQIKEKHQVTVSLSQVLVLQGAGMEEKSIIEFFVEDSNPKKPFEESAVKEDVREAFAKESPMFSGMSGKNLGYSTSKYYAVNAENDYDLAGKFMAMSFLHGGPGPNFFSEHLYDSVLVEAVINPSIAFIGPAHRPIRAQETFSY